MGGGRSEAIVLFFAIRLVLFLQGGFINSKGELQMQMQNTQAELV
jgi:hypothetical protein